MNTVIRKLIGLLLGIPILTGLGCKGGDPAAANRAANSTHAVVESEWQPVGKLEVSTGKVWAGDAQYAPIKEDGQIVDLDNGRYEAFVKTMDFGDDRRYSRLRLVSGSDAELGKQIGETYADSGSQGVCDYGKYKAAMPKTWDAYWKKSEEFFVSGKPERFELDPATGAVLIMTPSGFGDGVFTLFELVRDGKRCGIEIEMIAPDETYPFAAK